MKAQALLTQIAAMAELEADLIGERTKNALAAARKRIARTGQRGRPDIKRLGNPNGARALKGKQVGNAEAVAKLKATAAQRAADLKAIVDDIKRSGITSVRGIAEELYACGIRAPRGDTWHPTAVSRLLTRTGTDS
jgi:DNA invertase Pin-like site-specific DNA recombinase